MRQALVEERGNKEQKKQFKQEIEQYLQHTEQQKLEYELKNVYVTNHDPKQKKLYTISENEDQQFYNYKKQLEEYNSQATPHNVLHTQPKYERGTLLQ